MHIAVKLHLFHFSIVESTTDHDDGGRQDLEMIPAPVGSHHPAPLCPRRAPLPTSDHGVSKRLPLPFPLRVTDPDRIGLPRLWFPSRLQCRY